MIIMPYGWPWPIDTAHKPGRLLAPHRRIVASPDEHPVRTIRTLF